MHRVYMDANATTPLLPEVMEAMRPYWMEHFGNASSIHLHGQQAHAAVDRSREIMAPAAAPGAGLRTRSGSRRLGVGRGLLVQLLGHALEFVLQIVVRMLDRFDILALQRRALRARHRDAQSRAATDDDRPSPGLPRAHPHRPAGHSEI